METEMNTSVIDAIISDRVNKASPVIEKFMRAFSCNRRDLMDSFVRWTEKGEPTLTLMVGTGDNGKSALVKYVQNLYGPSVCSTDLEEEIDPTVVDTCFISEMDDFINNESKVRDFPCINLVYVTNCDVSLPAEFGGRKVFKLVFPSPIAPELRDPNILEKVTSLEGRAAGLMWFLENYEPEDLYAL